MEETGPKLDFYYESPRIPKAKRGKFWIVKKALIITLLTIAIGIVLYSSRKSFNCAGLMLKINKQNQLKAEPVAKPIQSTCSNSTDSAITKTIQVDECQLRKELPKAPTKFQFVTTYNYSVIARVSGYIQYHLDPYDTNQTSLVAKYIPIELEAVEWTHLNDTRRKIDFQLKCGNMSVEYNKRVQCCGNEYYKYRQDGGYKIAMSIDLGLSHPLHERCKLDVDEKYSYASDNAYYKLYPNSKWCKQKLDSVPELGEVTCDDVISFKCLKTSKYSGRKYALATVVLDALEFEIDLDGKRIRNGRFSPHVV